MMYTGRRPIFIATGCQKAAPTPLNRNRIALLQFRIILSRVIANNEEKNTPRIQPIESCVQIGREAVVRDTIEIDPGSNELRLPTG